MNLDHLQEFVVLAELLNYTAAAAKLHVTQPALSRHIASLERELGTPLFVRDTHRVELTPMGKELLSDASEILAMSDRMLRKTRVGSVFKIGGPTELFHLRSLVSSTLKRYETLYPDLRIEWITTRFDDYRKQLLDGSLDVVFSGRFNPDCSDGIVYHDLFFDPFVIVFNKWHPCASIEHPSLADFNHGTWRTINAGGTIEDWTKYVQGIFAKYDLDIKTGKMLNDCCILGDDEFYLTVGEGPDHKPNNPDHTVRYLMENEGVTISLAYSPDAPNCPITAEFVADVLNELEARNRADGLSG